MDEFAAPTTAQHDPDGFGGRRPRRPRRGLARLSVVLVAVFLLVACRPFGMVGDPSFAPVSSPGDGLGTPEFLVDVRTGKHAGFERVVLELTGDRQPSWTVAYAEGPVRQPGSGDIVEVDGDAVLVVHVAKASTVDRTTIPWTLVYPGPDRVVPAVAGVVTEVVLVGEFEGNLVWAIGLDQRVGFAAVQYDAPSRIVIDVLAS